MAYQFKLIAGTHRSENKRYTKGNLIVSDVRLDQKFKNKFEFIGKVSNSQKAASTDSETIVKVDDNDSDETTIEKREKYILEKVGNRFNVLNTETEELCLKRTIPRKSVLLKLNVSTLNLKMRNLKNLMKKTQMIPMRMKTTIGKTKFQ